MCCQGQSDLVVSNVNVRVMIHAFSRWRDSIDESDTLHEVFEDVEFVYAFASKLPAFQLRQRCFDLTLLKSHLNYPKSAASLRLDLGVNVAGLQTSTADLLIDLPQQKNSLVSGRVSCEHFIN